MNINLFFLLSISLLVSCGGQNATTKTNNSSNQASTTIGDTVKKIGNNIMTIYQDKKNNYWFGSWETGLYKYDGKNLLHFTTQHGLPHNRVEEIQEDKFGNFFITTSNGICKFDGQKFHLLIPKESTEWKLEANDLWFKSWSFDGKVCRYDGKDLYSLPMPKNQIGEDWIAKHPTHPSPYAVYTIYKDSKGNIWFGTAASGACRYNGKTTDWILEEDLTEFHYNSSNGVRSIIEDKDGYFWFNSAYRYRMDDTQKPFYTREKSIGNLDGQANSNFWEYLSIAKDNQNNLWITTYTNGIWRYNGKTTTHYPIQANSKDITLFYIYKDNNGGLWVGTHENGVFRWNGVDFEGVGF